jgi:hypothetical protein
MESAFESTGADSWRCNDVRRTRGDGIDRWRVRLQKLRLRRLARARPDGWTALAGRLYLVVHGNKATLKNRGAEAPRPVMQNSTSVLL